MKNSKRLLLISLLNLSVPLIAQVGINVNTPTTTLDVGGNAKIRGLTNRSDYKDQSIVVADKDGELLSVNPSQVFPLPDRPGTVISDGKNLIIAQEITALMDADMEIQGDLGVQVITAVNNKIIDNENTLNKGVFSVSNDGIYQIMINVQIHSNAAKSHVIGVWDDTDNKWIARVNDSYTAPTTEEIARQTYTLMTTVELVKAKQYSFRAAVGLIEKGLNLTIKQKSGGSSGEGYVSFFSVKRLK